MTECSENGCDRAVHSRGLCQAHYRQVRRRERDPETGTRKPGPVAKPGAESHQALDADEKERRWVARLAEKAAKAHCVHNHALTPENTYVTTKGQKICRICQRAAQQAHHGRPVDMLTPVGPRNKDKTHCSAGHSYVEHGRTRANGTRTCNTCNVNNRRKQIYDLTPEQYDTFMSSQGSTCAICHNNFKNAKDTHIDHDHLTGAVRALLCSGCNVTLGHMNDDPSLLRAAAEYIEYFKALQVEPDND